MFSKNCPIAIAGGDDDNNYGTSFTKIKNAINQIYTDDGVCIVCDIGSSIMTSQMVIEEFDDRKIELLNCPLLEGLIIVATSSEQGKTIEEIIETIKNSDYSK